MMNEALHILLVEDNAGDAELMEIFLEGINNPRYVITTVSRLSQALTAMTEMPFDLILLDLGLPDSDGLDTLQKIIGADPTLPVVVLTGNLDEQLAIDAVKSGAEDFLIKGHISSQLLSRVLRYALERKKNERSLRKMELLLRTTLDSLDTQVLLMGTDHRIMWPNRKVCKTFEYEREDIIGKFCYELWPRQDNLCKGCPVELAMASGEVHCENRWLKIGRTWDIKACPVLDDQDKVISIVELRNDISEQVLLEEQFLQAQKMEAVGRLAGGVAHDFNNMLSVILGNAEMAQSAGIENAGVAEYLEEILEAGRKSAQLVKQLLAFSRRQPINPQIIDCNTMLLDSRKMLNRLVGEDVEVSFTPTPGLWKISLDPTQFDQIIANLTVNARDAIPGIGKIIIETENIVLDDEYCKTHVYARPGEYVMLAFSDNGCGMPKEIQNKIFEPFFTTKEHGKGTGLGMATIFGIVKQNNGIINIYSEVGHGTTIKIFFPRSNGVAVSQNNQKVLEKLTGTETILIVEDEPAILRLCQSVLQELGYATMTSSDPLSAIDMATHSARPIDLLFTDVIMPHMNGNELRIALEKHFPALRTLFMSGYTSGIIGHQGIIEDSVSFISKPFTKEQLALKIREILDA
jgi:signal transduction histidine kinase/DNA-binding response OmpR family regulator